MKIKKLLIAFCSVTFITAFMMGVTAFASLIYDNPATYSNSFEGTYVYSGLRTGYTVTHPTVYANNQGYGSHYKKAIYSEFGYNNGNSYLIYQNSNEGTDTVIQTDVTHTVSSLCRDRIHISSIYKTQYAASDVKESLTYTIRGSN